MVRFQGYVRMYCKKDWFNFNIRIKPAVFGHCLSCCAFAFALFFVDRKYHIMNDGVAALCSHKIDILTNQIDSTLLEKQILRAKPTTKYLAPCIHLNNNKTKNTQP